MQSIALVHRLLVGSREKAGGKRAGHFDSVPEVSVLGSSFWEMCKFGTVKKRFLCPFRLPMVRIQMVNPEFDPDLLIPVPALSPVP